MKECKKHKEPCGCKITLPVECIRWYGENTTFLPIKTNENLESILIKIENYLQDLNPSGEISLQNIGEGQQVYKGISTAGIHEFRTLEAGENISISQNAETLIISSEYDIPTHNTLPGLQGGTAGEYYHLTQAQYNALGTIPTLQQVVTSGNTITFGNGFLSTIYRQPVGATNAMFFFRNPSSFGSALTEGSFYLSRFGGSYPNGVQSIKMGRILDTDSISPYALTFTNGNTPGAQVSILPEDLTSISGIYESRLQAKSGTLAHLSDIPNFIAGTNITIDKTDPLNQIINSSGGGGGLSLGETSTTAYRGDRGKIAYDYSQIGHIPTIQKGIADGVATLGSDGKVPPEQLPAVSSNAVSYDVQTPTLEQQAQARENIGVTASFYDQKFVWNSTTNVSKEFTLDFEPTQVIWTYNTNTPIWMDEDDFEIEGTTLTILTDDIESGAIIRIGYYHE